jgi:hypothetical protein
MDTPIEQLPICTRPLCFCYLLTLDSTNKEFEKCKHRIKHAYLHELKNSEYIFEVCPSYKFCEGEIKFLNELIEERINELKKQYAINIIIKFDNLGEKVTGIFSSKASKEHKYSACENIMKTALQLVADFLDVTGEALPKSNGDNIIHYAGTIEQFGGDIGRVRLLKIPTEDKNKSYKYIMRKIIQFIANYLDSTGGQLPPANE